GLRGGRPVGRAGDAGRCKIGAESGVAAGVRRIEAITGKGAFDWVSTADKLLKGVTALVRGSREDVVDKVQQLIERSRGLEREVQTLKAKLASGGGGRDLLEEVTEVGGVK